MSEDRFIRTEEIASPEPRSIAIGPFGSSMKSEVYTDSGVPVVRGKDINSGRGLRFVDPAFVSPDFADDSPAWVAKREDLVFPHRGAIGRVGIVDVDQVVLSTSMMKLSVDTERFDPKFVFYFFRGLGHHQLMANASTVGTPGIAQPLATLKSVMIPNCKLSTQKGIAEVLGALDDKIAANERVVTLNKALSKSIYQGAPRVREKPLSSVSSFVNGRAFTKNASGTGRVVIRISELNSGIGSSTVFNDIEVNDSNIADPGDLLFAWSGSLTVARWFDPQAIVNQHIFKVGSLDGSPMWLVREILNEKLDGFKSIASDKATTMGHIKRSHLDELVAIPSEPWIQSHFDLMSGLWDMELELELGNRKLARTRDELLPLLMNGKITVKDAEAVVSDAV